MMNSGATALINPLFFQVVVPHIFTIFSFMQNDANCMLGLAIKVVLDINHIDNPGMSESF